MEELTYNELLNKCIADFNANKNKFKTMYDYYNADTDAIQNGQSVTESSNNKVKCNFIKKFIKEEVSYILGNKVKYISKLGNKELINEINLGLAHWSEKHDQNLCRQALIYGTAYELYFIDSDGLFNSRIISPQNGYCLLDNHGNIKLFLHFFKLQLDDTQYLDVYNSNSINHYSLSENIPTSLGSDTHIFGQTPVGYCSLSEEQNYDTLYNDLKGLQDVYQTNLSDITNEISEFRNANLTFTGCKLDGGQLNDMKKLGIINLPDKDSKAEWLIKNINDTFVQNTLKTVEDKIYQISSHINHNDIAQNNISSLALRARLISLENKCKLNIAAIADTIKTRIKFLLIYINVSKSQKYDYRDIKAKFTSTITQDDLMMAKTISEMSGKISIETALAQMSFIDNVPEEIQKLQKQNSTNS